MDSLRSWLLCGLIFLVLAFCLTDCKTGPDRFCPATVRQHVYRSPYTSLSCTSTQKGGTHCHTIYHPAEYHLLIECRQPVHVVNLTVTEFAYAHYQDGASVTVGERLGHWTRTIWSKWIATDQDSQY